MTADAPLIEPRRIPGDPEIDHPIVLVLFEPYLETLGKTLKMKKSSWKRMRFPSLSYGTAEVDGKSLSVFGAPLGSPQAALVLERLIAMGAGKVVTFGCCGSLQFTLRTGDLVIPTHALSEEGTSAHYPLPDGLQPKADESITQLIRKCCFEKRLPWADGRVWTTDAIFRETKSKVSRYAEMDILAVEMEMSALFTVAAYRRISLGGLLVVSDELARPSWKSGFLNPSFWLTSKKAAGAVVEVCLSL
jgi:uridine phosphorylase